MAGKGNGGCNFLWTIFWFIILLAIGMWLAAICAGFHILLQPFSVFFEGCGVRFFFFFIKPNLTYLSNTTFDFTLLQSIMEMLMKGILFPRFCSENMIYGRAGF